MNEPHDRINPFITRNIDNADAVNSGANDEAMTANSMRAINGEMDENDPGITDEEMDSASNAGSFRLQDDYIPL